MSDEALEKFVEKQKAGGDQGLGKSHLARAVEAGLHRKKMPMPQSAPRQLLSGVQRGAAVVASRSR